MLGWVAVCVLTDIDVPTAWPLVDVQARRFLEADALEANALVLTSKSKS